MSDKARSKNSSSPGHAPKVPPAKVSAPVHHDKMQDGPPPLNADLLASYRDSQHRLLLLLGLILAFVIACFPISDPDIFFSLQVGKMVTSGEFPWGSDPFCFGQGEQAPWVHSGWLGDTIIYGLYQAGGGPLLVFIRSLLMVLLFGLLMHLGEEHSPRLWTVLAVLLGILAVSQRIYFRTELFSIVLLGVTFYLLAKPPRKDCWFARMHGLTAGRWYWLLPLLFLLWANLDGWFFLGLVVVIVWCAGAWLSPNSMTKKQLQALTISTLLCVVASCCSPFHVKALMEIPVRLSPPTAHELHVRYEEQKIQNPKQRFAEQQRFFESPWNSEFFQLQRSDAIASMASQAPLLSMCYPSGLSFSEWAYYPLTILVALSLFFARRPWSWGQLALLVVFVILGAWQNRFAGFFAIGGTALAILHFQSNPARVPSLGRMSIFGGQILCLVIGLIIQILCLLHLIPTPDHTPSALGHVHPRGPFGFAFRSDPSYQQACEVIGHWQSTHQLAGKPFHFDWSDVVGYDVWYAPGSRHLFDRRYEVHDTQIAKEFITASDAILGVALDPIKEDGSNLQKSYDRQAIWQAVFLKYDISYLIVKKRGQQQRELLVRGLLMERDTKNQQVWKPLKLHNGQIYALAWTGSRHWNTLQKLEFFSGEEVFQRTKPFPEMRPIASEKGSFIKYLMGDAVRRPAALDEASWHLFYAAVDPVGHLFRQDMIPQPAGRVASRLADVAVTLTLKLANPVNTTPLMPLWIVRQHESASSYFLSLESARRALAELNPQSTPQQRLDIWLQYLQAVTLLSEYEQIFTPAASAYREPLRLFLLRQTSFATLEAAHFSAFLMNLQLARTYRSSGALDAALEHYLLARQFFDQHPGLFAERPEQMEAILKDFDTICKRHMGITPVELRNEVTRQQESWAREVARAGWQPQVDNPGKDVVNRAGLAMRLGLPKKALDDLIASGVKSVEVSRMACQIYTLLGQHDIVLEEFLERSPELRQALDPIDYHFRASLGEWSLGRPDRAAEHRLKIAQLMDMTSRQSMLEAGRRSIFGTSSQPIGNVLTGAMLEQQAASETARIAEQKIAAGLLFLEAGKPQAAADLFRQALKEVEPATPWRPLLERYYQQITGEVLR